MGVFVKEMFRKFHELPKNITARHYRFFVITNYTFLIAGLFHLIFIGVFALLGIKTLAVYNIFSSLLWGICIYLNCKGFKIMPFVLTDIEVLIHAALCVVIIGWGAGFHYYILAVPLLIFFYNLVWRLQQTKTASDMFKRRPSSCSLNIRITG